MLKNMIKVIYKENYVFDVLERPNLTNQNVVCRPENQKLNVLWALVIFHG